MQYASKVILHISLTTMSHSYNKADVDLMWTFLFSIGILGVKIFMIFMIWIMNIYDYAI